MKCYLTLPFVLSCILIFVFGLSLPCAIADEIGGSGCGPLITLTGDVSHARYDLSQLEGELEPSVFVEEIYGKRFTAVVEALPPGDYIVEVLLAEMSKKEAGARVFDIRFGQELIGDNIDLFERVGYTKPCLFREMVTHSGDAVGGPFTLTFEAERNNAKFNSIRIKDESGNTVTCGNAQDFVNEDDEWASAIPEADGPVLFLDTTLPFSERADDLIRRLSLKEKTQQLMNSAPAIDRLGVPGYDYWNECLHGVARAGNATVFPQAIGLAAMWDVDEMRLVADTIATEGRAKNNGFRAENPTTERYQGLTFWTPNINIFRDPRWGRGHETYGEDPYLTSRLAVSFIQGLQGDNQKYLKAMACAKHFAVHSGPEKLRHSFDAKVSERDLYETYLPQFEAAVKEGQVGIVMSAYNAVQGIPAPASEFLLTELLRERWGFAGHVVSDCGAIRDIWHYHDYVDTPESASAVAIRAGNDLNCGRTYKALTKALREGKLDESDLDTALKRVLLARFRLGLFDLPEECAFLGIGPEENDTPEHSALALDAARKSIVLLTNDGTLPIDAKALRSIAVIGPNADSVDALLGNYAGTPSHPVTILSGIREAMSENTKVRYAYGCPLALNPYDQYDLDSEMALEAIEIAMQSELVVFVGGLDASVEGEEMRVSFDGFDAGDRTRIELPKPQKMLVEALVNTGRPVVYLNLSGGAVAMPWVAENAAAVLQVWYPGQNGGEAVADILLGNANPSGRLPVTFYRSTEDLPDFLDYSMENRTYRYFRDKPLFPFGHGLSYTEFEYGSIEVSDASVPPDGKVSVRITVANTGASDGDEVVQLYARHLDSRLPQAIQSLAGFKKVSLRSGERSEVEFELSAQALRYWDTEKGDYAVSPGKYEIRIGGSSQDIRSVASLEIL